MKQISDLDMRTIDNNIWTYFLKSLQENENKKHGFWTDGEEIRENTYCAKGLYVI